MIISATKPEEICRDHFLLKIKTDDIISSPGQFVNLKITGETDPLLRRPFSIHDHYDDIIEIIFRVVGKGTALLRDLRGTAGIDFMGPFGSGFSPVENGRVLIIGGGTGNAPLYYLAKLLRELGNKIVYFYGAKSAGMVFLSEKYRSVADELIITTDNGSSGRKGFVTEHAREFLERADFDFVYSCGPDIMMKTIVNLMNGRNTPVEVSVEKYFGCGFGVCSGCVVETRGGLKRACVDGPVFDGRALSWDTI